MAQSKPRPLPDRTFAFACDIVRFCRTLSVTPGVHRLVASQLLRSGTSVGANVAEAKAAFTRRDFANRYALVLRESRETQYWLRLIEATELADPKTTAPLLAEATELVAILTVAARKAKEPPVE
jgi:four helix bundle protein